MSKGNGRYCLKQDEDSHWYLVPADSAEDFETERDKAYASDFFDNFEDEFGHLRIDSPFSITFALVEQS